MTSPDAYPSECYKLTLEAAIKNGRTYHYTDCKLMCFQKLLTSVCKCQESVFDKFDPNVDFCKSRADIPCVYEQFNEFTTDLSILEECDCPLECSNTNYVKFGEDFIFYFNLCLKI